MIKPLPISISANDGSPKSFTISRFPAAYADEILTGYLQSGSRDGDYEANEAVVRLALAYVMAGDHRLDSDAAIDQHTEDWKMLKKLETVLLDYNTRFFEDRSPIWIPNMDTGGRRIAYKNIDGMIGSLISDGSASLHELRTIYDLDDAYLMWEANAVPKVNEYLAARDAAKDAKR